MKRFPRKWRAYLSLALSQFSFQFSSLFSSQFSFLFSSQFSSLFSSQEIKFQEIENEKVCRVEDVEEPLVERMSATCLARIELRNNDRNHEGTQCPESGIKGFWTIRNHPDIESSNQTEGEPLLLGVISITIEKNRPDDIVESPVAEERKDQQNEE